MRLIAIVISIFPSFVIAADISLVREGKSSYAIVTPAEPTSSESLAATELAKYFKLISGATLQIEHGGALPDRAIVVADSAHAARLAPKAKLPDLGGDAFAIVSDDSRIYLIGARPRATLYAVYHLLDSM